MTPDEIKELKQSLAAFDGYMPLEVSIRTEECHLLEPGGMLLADFNSANMCSADDDARCRAVMKIINALPSLLAEMERIEELVTENERLKAENLKLRKISCYVPARVYIESQEKAGYPNYIHTAPAAERTER
jgi:hypothetical protein